ncbi:MAG: SGNH/GDSL hydrolase family protein [Dehalococcoidia bacterium]
MTRSIASTRLTNHRLSRRHMRRIGGLAAYPPFRQGQFDLRNDDLSAFNDILRRQPDPVVDTGAALGRPAPPELFNPDGVHPSLAGHTVIARAFVEHLAT